MGFQLENGVGTGYRARVNGDNQLSTQAEVLELQHYISRAKGQSYQVIGDYTVTGAGTHTLLHITNDDSTRDMVISYMRVQYPGGDGTVDAATYFQLGFDTVYSSGGSTVTPTNVNGTSGNLASVTAYDNGPTVTGSFEEIDRWYPDSGMQVFNKHGSVILGLSDTIEWRLVTDQTAGLVYCRLTFMMIDKDN